MNVLNLGDYIEAVTGLTAACANVSQTENIKKKMISDFSTCLSKLSGDKPTEVFGKLVSNICNSQFKYILCWEHLNEGILKECGKDKEPLVPALYVGTVFAICGSDHGVKRISEFENPSNSREVAKSCPNFNVEVFQNFQEHCVNLLAEMESPTFCIRRKAILKCMDQLFSMVCTVPLPSFLNVY
ncbi:unnamed protein product [Orchesella dallaii]|uniref:Uncharacterized protein n=1 Tax=Orchesella dallaii TaxID=48710 RepID=A0ABP1S7P7_9HEXA